MDLHARSQSYRIAILVLLCIYATAFFLPALEGKPGWSWFLLGGFYCWLPLYGLIAFPVAMMSKCSNGSAGDWLWFGFVLAWWANPCLWIGLVMVLKRRWSGAIIAGSIATLLALLCLPMMKKDVPGLGYWLWVSSMIGLLIVAVEGQASEPIHPPQRLRLDLLEFEDAPFRINDERIRRMEPIDAIHRSSGPGL